MGSAEATPGATVRAAAAIAPLMPTLASKFRVFIGLQFRGGELDFPGGFVELSMKIIRVTDVSREVGSENLLLARVWKAAIGRTYEHMSENEQVNQNPEKDPDDWVTGDEPMTGPQKSYLGTLAQEAGEDVPEGLSKAQASEMIDKLQGETGRG